MVHSKSRIHRKRLGSRKLSKTIQVKKKKKNYPGNIKRTKEPTEETPRGQRWYNLSISKRNYNVFKTSNNLKSTIAWYSKQKKTKLKPASPVQTIHQVIQIQINNEHISLCKSLPANKWRKIKRTGILPVYRARKKSCIKGREHKPTAISITKKETTVHYDYMPLVVPLV